MSQTYSSSCTPACSCCIAQEPWSSPACAKRLLTFINNSVMEFFFYAPLASFDHPHWEQKKCLYGGWLLVMLGAVTTTTLAALAVNMLHELWLVLSDFITSWDITPVYDDRTVSCIITHFSFAYTENYIVPGNAINIHFCKSNINQLRHVTEKTPFTVLGSTP